MDSAWLGDIHTVPGLTPAGIGVLCMTASALCGSVIGLERERRDKPAGLRTVILICLGSTIFTLVSILIAATKSTADPARLAAQILPGIGFLGAGAIIHGRGTVVGLTTGATIWATAAVGVTIGSGHIAAGIVFTAIILAVLTLAHRLTFLFLGRCERRLTVLVYDRDSGRALPRLQAVLDRNHIPDGRVRHAVRADGLGSMEASLCVRHREHRSIFEELVEIPQVVELSE